MRQLIGVRARVSLCAAARHCPPLRSTTVCRCMPLRVAACHVPMCVAVCHCVSLCVPVCHCVSLCVTVCHCVSLCVTVCLCATATPCVTACLAPRFKVRATYFAHFACSRRCRSAEFHDRPSAQVDVVEVDLLDRPAHDAQDVDQEWQNEALRDGVSAHGAHAVARDNGFPLIEARWPHPLKA